MNFSVDGISYIKHAAIRSTLIQMNNGWAIGRLR